MQKVIYLLAEDNERLREKLNDQAGEIKRHA